MIPVCWLDDHTLCWDQALVDDTLNSVTWPGGHPVDHVTDEPIPHGVLVVPARYHDPDEINARLATMEWAVVVLTSDEEYTFNPAELVHDRLRVWVQDPRTEVDRPFVLGYPNGTAGLVVDATPTEDWFFSGQINHPRRRAAAKAMRRMRGGTFNETPGFTQGFERSDYLEMMCGARVVPCPSGPATPDSFRVWEALEAGAVPLVDRTCPRWAGDLWSQFAPPFPLIDDWRDLSAAMTDTLDRWPRLNVDCQAWWQQHKRTMHRRLHGDITDLSGQPAPESPITVIIPTSPIRSNPSTAIIEETVATVRRWLPNAEILIAADGVRPEQTGLEAAYLEYLRRVCRLCELDWHGVVPVLMNEWGHQANTTRMALDLVDTPLVLFVEHDTPLTPDCDIPFATVAEPLLAGELDVVRFHHEAHIHPEHEHLMVDHDTVTIGGLPCRRTLQWSQRPHLVRTDYYRRILAAWFPPASRTMIEDRMHGVCQDEPWEANRLAVFHPDGGNIKRSYHLDGRGAEPKYEMRFH